MTINEAIERLKTQQKKHGNIEVYFDCPTCGQSFTPNTVVAVAVHLAQAEADRGRPGEPT